MHALPHDPTKPTDASADDSEETLATEAAPRERVLVVEDDPEVRLALVELLSLHWDVAEAADGLEALELIGGEAPDLVLSDLLMPRLDGLELVRQLRAEPRSARLPVVVVTARSKEDSLLESFTAGADDFVQKPFTGSEILARIRKLLAAARSRRRVEEALCSATLHLSATEDRLRQEVVEDVSETIGESLTMIKLHIERVWAAGQTPPPIQDSLQDALTLTSSALEELSERSLLSSHDAFEVLSLEDTLTRDAAQWAAQLGMRVRVTGQGQPWPLGSVLQGFVCRAVRELLVEAARYGGARAAEVALMWDAGGLSLLIHDDGRSVVEDRGDTVSGSRRGRRILKLRERMEHLGGRLLLLPRRGQGTTLSLEFDAGCFSGGPADDALLTRREKQVLQLIAEGKSSVEIGMLLQISSRTVDTHRLRLMRKLRVHTIAGLTKFAVRIGLCSLD